MKYDYQTKTFYSEGSLDQGIKDMGLLGYRVLKMDKFETGRDTWDEYNNQKQWKARQYVVIFEREVEEAKKKKQFVQLRVSGGGEQHG